VTPSHGVLAWSLPAGIATTDIGFISFWTLVSAVVIGLIGVITLRVMAARSVRFMVTGVVLVSVATSMAGVAVIAYRMLPGVNQDVVLDLMAIAGLAGLIVALVVDLSAHEVRADGKLVQLTSREYDLLVFLMRNPRKAFTREQLLSEVWSWTFGDTSTVTVHVRRLREKLEPDPTLPRRIVTVWGVGYRYEPEAA